MFHHTTFFFWRELPPRQVSLLLGVVQWHSVHSLFNWRRCWPEAGKRCHNIGPSLTIKKPCATTETVSRMRSCLVCAFRFEMFRVIVLVTGHGPHAQLVCAASTELSRLKMVSQLLVFLQVRDLVLSSRLACVALSGFVFSQLFPSINPILMVSFLSALLCCTLFTSCSVCLFEGTSEIESVSASVIGCRYRCM